MASISHICALLCALTLQASASWDTGGADSSMTTAPVRIDALRPVLTATKPVIDGNLDEQCWISAPHVTGFKTFAPDFDVLPKEQTEVALAYDRENLYFAFRCYDDVTKIKASVSPRDKMTQDDFI